MAKSLHYYQIEAHEAVFKAIDKGIVNQLLAMATGCHAKGTKILMYDGYIKNVEDIVPGELLMGNDNTPRKVLQLARGRETMYKIIPVKGESFIVNESHILSLKRTGKKREGRHEPDYVNITVKDYLEQNNHFKHLYKQYRVSVDFPNIGSETHPYWIGLWLGDGTFDRPQITNPDKEIQNWLLGEFSDFCKWNHPEIKISFNTRKERCDDITFIQENSHLGANSILNFIRTCTKTKEKRIPDRNLRNSRENRLELLAGLIDSDGYYNDGGYEIITKYDGLCDDILFLARSLGFAAYKSKKIGSIKKLNFKGEYWRIFISGDCSKIPCKVERKKSKVREQIKDVLVTGFSIEKLEVDDYYGFSLDGNHLYCMSDFTVTHNTGKTFTAVSLIQRLRKERDFKRVLWGTHTEELLEQSAIALLAELDLMSYEALLSTIKQNEGLIELLRKGYSLVNSDYENLIIDNIGIIKADLFIIDKPIVIASMQTLWRRLDRIPEDYFDMLVADECHLFAAKTYKMSMDHFKVKLRLGLSATPYRMDGMLMGDVFDEIVYDYPIEKAIKDGYLCEIDAIRVKTDINLDKVKTTAGELNQKELEVVINTPARNKLIVQKYKEFALGRQFIAFCVDVQHAMDLCATFNELGVFSNFIVGDERLTPDRRDVIEKLKNGHYTGLTNVMVLTAGFDHPNIGCVIEASPTKSLTKYLQTIGRGTRLKSPEYVAKFGQNVIVLDVMDATSRHSLINTWTLEKGKPLEERVFLTKEKKLELIIKRDAKAKLQVRKKDERVNLLKLPKVEISNSIRMQEPATEKQLAWVARLGYDVQNINYTKAMCSEIISQQPATEAQIWRLAKEGYDVSQGVTVAEASLAFKQIEENKDKARRDDALRKANFPFNDLK